MNSRNQGAARPSMGPHSFSIQENGQVKTPSQIAEEKGLCPTCNQQTHEINVRSNLLSRKKTPLTIKDKVKKGVCLICAEDRRPSDLTATSASSTSSTPSTSFSSSAAKSDENELKQVSNDCIAGEDVPPAPLPSSFMDLLDPDNLQVRTISRNVSHAEKNGLCPSCKEKTHKVYPGGFKEPLTVKDKVENGVCLKCPPIQPKASRSSKASESKKTAPAATASPSSSVSSASSGGTAGAVAPRNEQLAMTHAHANHVFDPDGRVRTPSERDMASKEKGFCPTCGVQTHKVTRLRRTALSVEGEVQSGVCLKCTKKSTQSGTGQGRKDAVIVPLFDARPSRPGPKHEGKIVKALRDHPHDTNVLCDNLKKLSRLGDAQNDGALSEVVGIMKHHSRDKKVLTAACGAIWGIVASTPMSPIPSAPKKIEAREVGAIHEVLKAVQYYEGDDAFFAWGAGVLSCLLSGVPSNGQAFVQANGIDVLVRSLRSHRMSEHVLYWSCRALFALVDGSVEGGNLNRSHLDKAKIKSLVVKAGTIQAVLHALKKKETIGSTIGSGSGSSSNRAAGPSSLSSVPLEWAFKFIFCLLNKFSDEKSDDEVTSLLKRILEEGGIDVCTKAIVANPSSKVLHELSFSLLSDLLEVADEDEYMGAMHKIGSDCIAIIFDSMRSHVKNASLQKESLRLLSILSSHASTCSIILDRFDGPSFVIECMSEHYSSVFIQKACCWFLWKMSSSGQSHYDSDVVQKVIATVSTGLHFYPSDAEYQCIACGVIANFVMLTSVALTDSPVRYIIELMQSNVGDAGLQDEACRAIRNICTINPSGIDEVVSSSGVEATITALNSSSSAQEEVVALLSFLCSASSSSRDALLSCGGTNAIIAAMKKHPDNTSVQFGACSILANLASSCIDVGLPFLKDETVQLIREVLERFSSNIELQEHACVALGNMAASAQSKGFILSDAQMADTLLQMISSDPPDQTLLAKCLHALRCWTSMNILFDTMPLNGLGQILLKRMIQFRGGPEYSFNPEIELEAIATVENLSYHSNDFMSSVGRECSDRLIDTLISIIYVTLKTQTDTAEMCERCLGALVNLVNGAEGERAAIGSKAFIFILNAMKKAAGNESIQEYGCILLSRLGKSNMEVNLHIAENNGIKIILEAMAFVENRRLQREALTILTRLSFGYESILSIAEQGGLALVCNAIRTYRDDAGLQEMACSMLCILITYIDEEAIKEWRIAEEVLQSMKGHISSANIQEKGLELLQTLCTRSTDLKKNVVVAGGIPTVIDSMMASIVHETAQKLGIACLGAMSSNGDFKNAIVGDRGIFYVICALWVHEWSEAVQIEGYKALSSLTSNRVRRGRMSMEDARGNFSNRLRSKMRGENATVGAINSAAETKGIKQDEQIGEKMSAVEISNKLENEITDFEIDPILSGMEHFPGNAELQEHAVLTLSNLTLSDANKDVLRRNRHKLDPLLHLASTKFPAHCSERVHQILAVIC